MTHDGLARRYGDSMDACKWQVFYGVRIGQFTRECPEADIFMMRKSYTQPDIRIIEVKVSTADLRKDVLDGKYRKYIQYCNHLLFLCGKGVDTSILSDQKDIGLIVENGSRFVTKRCGNFNAQRAPLTEDELHAIMMSHFGSNSRVARMDAAKEAFLKNELRAASFFFSKHLCERIRDLEIREHQCEQLEKDARNKALADLRAAIGLNSDSWWRDDVRKIAEDLLLSGLREQFSRNLENAAQQLTNPIFPKAAV